MATGNTTKTRNNDPLLAAAEIDSGPVAVTPELAFEYLQVNVGNRPVRKSQVLAFARDMKNGKWLYAGDPVRFAAMDDGTEVMIDGQHRMLAVIESGRTIVFKVEHGYSINVKPVIDTGTARDLADTLSFQGYANPRTLAAIARRVFAYRASGHIGGRTSKVTQSDVLPLIADEHDGPLLLEATAFSHQYHYRGFLPESMYGWLFFEFTRRSSSEPGFAAWFLDRVEDGADLPASHPIMAMRRRVIRDRQHTSQTRGRISEMQLAALVIIAWNHTWEARRKGKTPSLSKIQLPDGGLTASNFPAID